MGIDTADYTDSNAGVLVRLWNGTGVGGDAEGDIISGIENLTGSAFGDSLVGSNNVMNTLDGGAGNDFLYGLSGDDTLIGGAGADILDGGLGIDTMTGGAGQDFFVFADGFGSDTITDFANDLDKLDFTAQTTLTSLAAVLAVSSQVGADTVIALDANNTITLQNFTLADLDAADFVFASPAEAPRTDKPVVAEELIVSDTPAVSEALVTLIDKATIADNDSFVFVQEAGFALEKRFVADNMFITTTEFSDFALDQDTFSQFLAQAEVLQDSYFDAEGNLEIGIDAGDANLSYFTDFFNFI